MEENNSALTAAPEGGAPDGGAGDRVRADLAEFARAFPEAHRAALRDPKSLPADVWGDVERGLSLTAAYARSAVAKSAREANAARGETAAARRNAVNRARSAGSLRSAGMSRAGDAFLAGFEAN